MSIQLLVYYDSYQDALKFDIMQAQLVLICELVTTHNIIKIYQDSLGRKMNHRLIRDIELFL